MINALEEKESYNRFYAQGGWSYSREQQEKFVIERIIKPLGLVRGSKILEIGCGMGIHSALLHQLGFKVTAVDVSNVGIQFAKTHVPGVTFHCTDLAGFISEEPEYDVIYSRGMAWYHYELNTVNVHGIDVPLQTTRLFQMLKTGGIFVLQISTDFSGTVAESGVYNNKLAEYTTFFERLGEIVLLTNWNGEALTNQAEASRLGRNILIATRK
jgi:cyclopropane fatty-acyl-phospholipid synthase-like methyltransferase